MAPEGLKHECTILIVKAHTISKSSNLKQISENGHVLGFKKSITSLDQNNGIYPIEKIGINNASIFNGFCSKHDKELFSIIEDQKFLFSSEQIFMLAYRAICKELYLKVSSNIIHDKMRNYDKGTPSDMQMFIKSFVDFQTFYTQIAIRDLEKVKSTFDYSLIEKNFDQIKYYCIVIDSIPEIMSSGAWLPEIDFNNKKLLNLYDEKTLYNTLTVSTIALESNQGAIIFAWHNKLESTPCLSFIQSLHLIPKTEQAGAVLKWLFECNENIYWSEAWWDQLSQDSKMMLTKSMMNIGQAPDLKTDREKYNSLLSWNILEIKTNIYE